MSTSGGVEIGGGGPDEEEIREDPLWHQDWPLWRNKIEAWKILARKNCPGRMGPNFCSWGGHACYYNGCPRRIFEEVMIVQSALPPSPPSGKLRQKVQKFEKQMERFGTRLKKIEKTNAPKPA